MFEYNLCYKARLSIVENLIVMPFYKNMINYLHYAG